MEKKQDTIPRPAELQLPLEEADVQIRDRMEKGKALLTQRPGDKTQLDQIRKQFYTWDEYNATMLNRMFSSDDLSQEYSYWGICVVGTSTFSDDVKDLLENVTDKIRRLESIRERLPLYVALEERLTPSVPKMNGKKSRDVFVVHGRNNELKETVARFLSQLQLRPIILHEQANAGKTLIEKFEANADSCFAVVVLTPDDIGGLRTTETIDKLHPRARQNVIFEWGFFVANLGRRCVCALVAEGVELPSDMDGIAYVALDQHGAWKMLLARELKSAGIDVDLNLAI